MRFGQKVHPDNFEYASDFAVIEDRVLMLGRSFRLKITCQDIGGFCTCLHFDNVNVSDKRRYSDGVIESYREGVAIQPVLNALASFNTDLCAVEIGPAQFCVRMASGIVLKTAAEGVGVNGEQFAINFELADATGFYGFGERTKRLNKYGDSLDFWNVDVVAAFPQAYDRDDYDPAYVAIPFVILKAGAGFMGLYFDNPGRAVIDVGKIRSGQWLYQSLGGNTSVYLIDGPGLREVVRNFTRLTGRAEIPPLWSMGYHQCRWGYRSEADFRDLKERFAQHDIPVSALWYDIDYMDGYRLFTWNGETFPEPAALNRELKEAGIRSVTIIDPGIKWEPGYAVYDSGKAEDVFCKTVSGKDYVGRVWPGDTVFPDFSLPAVRSWWAGWLARFVEGNAVDGVWLDMNDPATGFSVAEDMRFEQGRVPHEVYHNQYAHLMARASREAYDRIDPDGRPFLLTRSGFTGTQRYSAIWTGDNASSWKHLRMTIPSTLNLGLSGVAFNGPDVGGFMGHTNEELLIRWYQACFLFPFFRNHSAWNSKSQEPWQFSHHCLDCVRAAIMTRYRLLPYLYQCFFEHYLSGDPILRPLLYQYNERQFEDLDDQYLVGSNILVAPILEGEGQGKEIVRQGIRRHFRYIQLPPGWWFDLNRGEWLEGNRVMGYEATLQEIPLFVRDGSIVPYCNGPLRNGFMAMSEIELHVFSKERPGELIYYIDDQSTRAYQRGEYNIVRIQAHCSDAALTMTIAEGGPCPKDTVTFKPVLYGCRGDGREVVMNGGKSMPGSLRRHTRGWVCKQLPVLA